MTRQKQQEELYLIDGSSYIFRAYHTTTGLSNSAGFPTGAIFGFTNMLDKTLKDRRPTRVAVVFDPGGPNRRHELYPAYKANRPPAPEDLVMQIPRIVELVEAYGIPAVSATGWEADDVIATLTEDAVKRGWRVVIVSGDKDLMQLVGDDVEMWDPQRDKVYDADEVKKKLGVGPQLVADLLALMGDASDNVPGVPGVGEKTAAKVLIEFGSLEIVYANLEAIPQKKLKENLRTNRDKAELSRRLVQLNRSVELEKGVEDLIPTPPDNERLRKMFKEFEFKRRMDALPPEKTLDRSKYVAVTTEEALQDWVSRIREKGRFAIDVETTSTEPVRADLVGVSICFEAGSAAYIPVGHHYGAQLPKEAVLAALAPVLEDPSVEKLGQNIKYDLVVLKREGVNINGVACDTMLASYLLDASRRSHSLDALAADFLNHTMIPIKDLIGTGKSQKVFSEVDIEAAAEYSAEDADATFRLAEILRPRVEAEGLGRLFKEVELPLIPILGDMEMAGVGVDTAYLKQLSEEFGQLVDAAEREVFDLAGETFNINSPKQLGEILFQRLGMKPIKKTKTGPSTATEVLEELALQHELPRKIVEYRSIYKLKSTYADALPGLVNPKTGRIHTSYNQAVAATGRLSSSDPNLQNIPVRSPEGLKIRRAFVPAPGHLFVAADYSQIELRVMAHVSGDARLSQAFASGEDIHAITAASVFGVPPAHVTPDMRRKAKEINFGIIFGMGAFKLARQINVGMTVARKYLDDYYQTYSGVKRFMDELPEQAAKDGYVTTILGRKRFLPDLNSPNKVAQQAARRVAVNTVIQGSAADLIKLAMIKVSNAIKASKIKARMILQVHDELILEADERAAAEAAALLKREMEGVYPLSAPLVVDTAIGANWGEAH
jgi:DNA polymerase-1